ncbi:MAG: thymidine kinase, partial [Phocaeicola sp.]
MSKLNFYYGAMASGKSLECIRVIHNYRERGFNPLILKPAVDDRSTTIQSRAGAEVDCIPLKRDEQIFHKMLEHRETDEIVIIDEAQFLTKRQVQELRVLSILQDVIVICFGLKVDYRGYFFEGS